MSTKLSDEERRWLKLLDTDEPTKPDLPEPISTRLIELGLAIKLVEGGLQLTALGRDELAPRKPPAS